MYKIKTTLVCVLSVLILSEAQAASQAKAQEEAKSGWELAFFLGTSFSKDETLTIKQDGFPDITLDNAQFSTKPFEAPESAVRVLFDQGYSLEERIINEQFIG